jgi:hypothetical protein
MRPGMSKRQKELSRQEHRKEKEAKKEQRKKDRDDRPAGATGEDPDIAGIVPGPQPQPDWMTES